MKPRRIARTPSRIPSNAFSARLDLRFRPSIRFLPREASRREQAHGPLPPGGLGGSSVQRMNHFARPSPALSRVWVAAELRASRGGVGPPLHPLPRPQSRARNFRIAVSKNGDRRAVHDGRGMARPDTVDRATRRLLCARFALVGRHPGALSPCSPIRAPARDRSRGSREWIACWHPVPGDTDARARATFA